MKEKHDAIQNIFALLFIIGLLISFVFNHVSEVVWWIGVLMLFVGFIGIHATDYFYERKKKDDVLYR